MLAAATWTPTPTRQFEVFVTRLSPKVPTLLPPWLQTASKLWGWEGPAFLRVLVGWEGSFSDFPCSFGDMDQTRVESQSLLRSTGQKKNQTNPSDLKEKHLGGECGSDREGSPSKHETLSLTPTLHKLRVVVSAGNPSLWVTKAGGTEVQGCV